MNLIDVWPQQPPSLELTRHKFEKLIAPLLNNLLTYVDAISKRQKQSGGCVGRARRESACWRVNKDLELQVLTSVALPGRRVECFG